MHILDKIIAHKIQEVNKAKALMSIAQLENTAAFSRSVLSLCENIMQDSSSGIIAEFKRKSPSRGTINDVANPVEVVKSYELAGASGSSVLTDKHFFGGTGQDFIAVRNEVSLPLLRKEFMIDEYQFIEAKSMGADVVLLIASILTPHQVKVFTDLAKSLQLEVLLELHGEEELGHVYHKVDMIGVNNRNLKNFEVNVEQSVRMAAQLNGNFVKVAESGISDVSVLKYYKENGFQGFLIGEHFMKTKNPGKTCQDFIQQL